MAKKDSARETGDAARSLSPGKPLNFTTVGDDLLVGQTMEDGAKANGVVSNRLDASFSRAEQDHVNRLRLEQKEMRLEMGLRRRERKGSEASRSLEASMRRSQSRELRVSRHEKNRPKYEAHIDQALSKYKASRKSMTQPQNDDDPSGPLRASILESSSGNKRTMYSDENRNPSHEEEDLKRGGSYTLELPHKAQFQLEALEQEKLELETCLNRKDSERIEIEQRYQTRIEELQLQVERFKNECIQQREIAEKRGVELQDALRSVDEKGTAVKAELELSQNTLEEYAVKVKELNAQLESSHGEARTMKAKAAENEATIAHLRKALDESQAEMHAERESALQRDELHKEEISKFTAEHQKACCDLKNSMTSLEATIDIQKDKIQRLERENEELKKLNEKSVSIEDHVKAKLEQLNSEVENEKALAAQLKLDMTFEHEETIARLKKTHFAEIESLEQATGKTLKDGEIKQEELQKKLEGIDSAQQAYRSEIEEQLAQLATILRCDTEFATIQSVTRNLVQDHEASGIELSRTFELLHEAKEKATSWSKKCESLAQTNHELEKNTAALAASQSALRDEIASLEKQLVHSTKEETKLKEHLHLELKRSEQLELAQEKLKEELHNQQEALNAAQSQYAKVTSDLSNVQRIEKELQCELQSQREALERTEAQHSEALSCHEQEMLSFWNEVGLKLSFLAKTEDGADLTRPKLLRLLDYAVELEDNLLVSRDMLSDAESKLERVTFELGDVRASSSEQVSELQARLDDAQKAVSGKLQCQNLEEEVDTLQQQVEQERHELGEARGARVKEAEALKDIRAAQQEERNKHLTLQEQTKNLQEEVDCIRRECEKELERLENLIASQQVKQQERQELDEQLKTLQEEVGQERLKLEQLRAQQQEDTESALKELEEQVGSLRESLERARSECTEKDEELEQLRAKAQQQEDTESALKELEEQVGSLRESLERARSECTEKDEELEQLRAKAQQQEDTESALKEMEEHVRSLQENLNQVQSEYTEKIEALEQLQAVKESDSKQEERDLMPLEEDLENLKKEVDQERRELEQLRSDREIEATAIEQLKAAKKDAQSHVCGLEQDEDTPASTSGGGKVSVLPEEYEHLVELAIAVKAGVQRTKEQQAMVAEFFPHQVVRKSSFRVGIFPAAVAVFSILAAAAIRQELNYSAKGGMLPS